MKLSNWKQSFPLCFGTLCEFMQVFTSAHIAEMDVCISKCETVFLCDCGYMVLFTSVCTNFRLFYRHLAFIGDCF